MKREILKEAFLKKKQFRRLKETDAAKADAKAKGDVPKGLYDKCDACNASFPQKEAFKNKLVCPNCQNHFRIRAVDRIAMSADPQTFVEKGYGYITLNPLFQDGYEQKIRDLKKTTGMDEAYVYGDCEIRQEPCIIGILDSHFMMGSMGSVVGEKVTKSVEYALYKKRPLVIFSASGGARMQEGIYSLMQMAKTSAAIRKMHQQGLLFISVLTHPTTGGVSASFAMLGDIILAEPGALIGFAGPRVIEQTIRQSLPEGFQRAEFLLEKGMIDAIVHRHDMRETLQRLLRMHRQGGA